MEMALLALRASAALLLIGFFGVLLWALIREATPRAAVEPAPAALEMDGRAGAPPVRFALASPTWIGRDPNCAVHLADEAVSLRHARIEWRPLEQSWWLEDVSRNGTLVNGERVASQVLRHDDVLVIGRARFRVVVGED